MNRQDVEKKLTDLTVEQLGIEAEKVTADAFLGPGFIPAEKQSADAKDLGMDSLDCVEYVMAIEEEFNLEVPDEDAEEIVTFGDVLNYLCDKLGVTS